VKSLDLSQRFVQEFESAGGVLLFPSDNESLERALVSMVEEEGITSYAVSRRTPRLKTIDGILKGAGLERSRDYPSLDMGITGAQGAGASTGTLVFSFQKGGDHLLTALPRVHLAVLKEADITPHVSESVKKLMEKSPPPYLSLVTGPSITGDIELNHVTGVHGPEKLYLVMVS
jgi:L-lactate dehydrogenase complex protein LldG